jgi:hypothetical protein
MKVLRCGHLGVGRRYGAWNGCEALWILGAGYEEGVGLDGARMGNLGIELHHQVRAVLVIRLGDRNCSPFHLLTFVYAA